jgi:hypothetical protein
VVVPQAWVFRKRKAFPHPLPLRERVAVRRTAGRGVLVDFRAVPLSPLLATLESTLSLQGRG